MPTHGDMIFDGGETEFWTYDSFKIVAMHEIGHSIALAHTAVAGSLMQPFYNASRGHGSWRVANGRVMPAYVAGIGATWLR